MVLNAELKKLSVTQNNSTQIAVEWFVQISLPHKHNYALNHRGMANAVSVFPFTCLLHGSSTGEDADLLPGTCSFLSTTVNQSPLSL